MNKQATQQTTQENASYAALIAGVDNVLSTLGLDRELDFPGLS